MHDGTSASMSNRPEAEEEIRFARRGDLMVVTLDRPRALNALTLTMCRALDEGLRAWQADPEIGAVVIKGAGERAFCAGGDIRWLRDVLAAEGVAAATAFYAVGTGSSVTFTLMRLPGVSAQQFVADAQAVERDLATLEALLERE
jgi:enoyl-CoA hydratase/carnithine racemase